MNSDSHRIFIGTSVHHWNDNRILYKEAISLSAIYNVELHRITIAGLEFSAGWVPRRSVAGPWRARGEVSRHGPPV